MKGSNAQGNAALNIKSGQINHTGHQHISCTNFIMLLDLSFVHFNIPIKHLLYYNIYSMNSDFAFLPCFDCEALLGLVQIKIKLHILIHTVNFEFLLRYVTESFANRCMCAIYYHTT